jgi:hypothetical protein
VITVDSNGTWKEPAVTILRQSRPSYLKEAVKMKEKSGLPQPVAEGKSNPVPPEYESDAISICQPFRYK